MIATGVLRGPHGIHGNIKLKTYSGEYEYLKNLREVELRFKGQKKIMTIEKFIDHGKELLIHFAGVHTPEEARRYNGWEIWVSRKDASPLEKGEFYVADLIGCSILFDGVTVGSIISTFDGAQSLLLEVAKTDGKKILIPFMPQCIGNVDTAEKRVDLLMEELLMNEPVKDEADS